MSHERNVSADAKFIEAGGLKDWGCYAFLLSVLALVILFFVVRALLTLLVGEITALWITVVVLIGAVAGIAFLWIRRRRRRKAALQKLQSY